MDSHEYALELKKAAEFLLSRPRLDKMATYTEVPSIYLTYYSKEEFIAAVRAMGAGEKQIDDSEVTFIPRGAPVLRLSAARSLCCRKIQDEKWECEPLLSDDETAALGTEAVAS